MAEEKTVDVKSLEDDSPIIFYTFQQVHQSILGCSCRFSAQQLYLYPIRYHLLSQEQQP